ncbi:MAG: multicopper oxidase domain-containing protein [Lysobacter sp.]|nr:multicopper oxidase domain-containing protein [Lysobacter sp.]
MTDTTRRRLFVGLAATAAALAATPWLFQRRREHDHAMNPTAPEPSAGPGLPNAQPFQTPLRLPGREGLFAEVALSAPLALSARAASFPIFAGKPTEVWHYAGHANGHAVANPLLRASTGDTVEVALGNRLAEATTIHWHGLSIDEANDGSGLHPVAAGGSARYRYRIDNRAGLYWYHAHPHERTGLQLQRGLAGLLRIEDPEERALGERLGLRWGERDLPLFIADKQVDADNGIVYRIGADDWIGNRVLVNWTPEPFLEVLPALYRLRLVNGCNARMLRIAFEHEGRTLPFKLIGTDGGLLAQAWTMDDVFLAPAQRIDVLVDFGALPAAARVLLRSLEYVAMENEDESGAFAPDPMADHPGAAPMGEALDLMQFRVAACSDSERRRAQAGSGVLPAVLSALPPPPDTAAWTVRPLRLRMDQEGTWFINDWNYHQVGHAPVFSVKRGSREVWEIRNNMTSMPHPIHVHGFQFRVVSRSISPPDVRSRKVTPQGLGPQDLGLNDTVVVWPGEIVRIAIDFSQPYRGTQRYMLHCHNLEHEDMGMMVSFAVED